MKLVIDGEIYLSCPGRGIAQIFSETLPRLCEQDEQAQVTLFLERCGLNERLPTHARIERVEAASIDAFFRPSRLWRGIKPKVLQWRHQRGVERRLRELADGIWHPTHYALPPSGWRGPTFLTVADLIHEKFPDSFRPEDVTATVEARREHLNRVDCVFVISENTKRDLVDYYGIAAEKVVVTPLCCSPDFCEGSAGEGEPFLLYVGARSGYKNFRFVLEAYANWSRKDRPKLLVVSQYPWDEEEERILAKHGLGEQVILRRGVDTQELRELYRSAAALIYPSCYEGFGIPLLEAMACTCPVVASRIPTNEEIGGEVPLFFELGEGDSLREALNRVLEEGRSSDRTRAGLRQRALYDWNKTAALMLEAYRRAA